MVVVVGGDWLGSHAILGGQFAFVKHLLESGRLFVACTGILGYFSDFQPFTGALKRTPLFPHHHPRYFTFSMCAKIKLSGNLS